jgi:rhodanese-related sulfurtransferase
MDVYSKYQNRYSTTPKTSTSEQMDFESAERPYLIVDLRDKDEFRANHIVSGNFIL